MTHAYEEADDLIRQCIRDAVRDIDALHPQIQDSLEQRFRPDKRLLAYAKILARMRQNDHAGAFDRISVVDLILDMALPAFLDSVGFTTLEDYESSWPASLKPTDATD